MSYPVQASRQERWLVRFHGGSKDVRPFGPFAGTRWQAEMELAKCKKANPRLRCELVHLGSAEWPKRKRMEDIA